MAKDKQQQESALRGAMVQPTQPAESTFAKTALQLMFAGVLTAAAVFALVKLVKFAWFF